MTHAQEMAARFNALMAASRAECPDLDKEEFKKLANKCGIAGDDVDFAWSDAPFFKDNEEGREQANCFLIRWSKRFR